MTREDLEFAVSIRQEIEFTFNGKRYTLTYGSSSGREIAFGRLYDQPELYASLNELLNRAKIENHFLRELLPVITPGE